MQVDCYKRNWHSSVCSAKCPFRGECYREWNKECVRNSKEKMKNE